MLESTATQIDVRLPNVGSPRAQRLIDAWAGLAPRLLLPLGMPEFHQSLVRGIAGAAKDVGHQGVTVLIGGITAATELQKFRDAVAEFDQLAVGAVIQNTAALQAATSMLEQRCPLWIDLREITRSFHGLPEALSFADDVLDGYTTDGYIAVNPRLELPPYLLEVLLNLSAAARSRQGTRLGIDCGSAIAPAIVARLYDAGLRTFSVPLNQHAHMRLMLAQRAP
jgi:pyruvate,orthophosphate dikinase